MSFIQKKVIHWINGKEHDTGEDYYNCCCDICGDELRYYEFYCEKCNNVVHPCDYCSNESDDIFVKTEVIYYQLKDDNYYKPFNNDANLAGLSQIITKCPMCNVNEWVLNCTCKGRCNCDTFGKDISMVSFCGSSQWKDGKIPKFNSEPSELLEPPVMK